MQKYYLEFVLHVYDASGEILKNSLAEFGEGLEVTDCQDGNGKGKNYRVRISTEDPTVIFDICAEYGRIKTVKINEGHPDDTSGPMERR